MKKWFFHKALNVEDQGDQKQLVLFINYTLSLIIILSAYFVNKRKISPERFSTEFCIYNLKTKTKPAHLKNILVIANKGTS